MLACLGPAKCCEHAQFEAFTRLRVYWMPAAPLLAQTLSVRRMGQKEAAVLFSLSLHELREKETLNALRSFFMARMKVVHSVEHMPGSSAMCDATAGVHFLHLSQDAWWITR